MRETLKQLYALQQIDTQIAAVEKARAGLDNGATLKGEVEKLRAALAAEQKRLRELEAEMHDRELQLKSTEAKRQQFRDRLFSGAITSSKELENVQREVEMLTKRKGDLEEAILLLMDDVEAQRQRTTQLGGAVADKGKQLSALEENYRSTLARLEAQLIALKAEREQAAAQIDQSNLRRYDAVRVRAHNLAVVKVDPTREVCPACSVALTSFVLRKLRESDGEVTCENCQRLLYWDGDKGGRE